MWERAENSRMPCAERRAGQYMRKAVGNIEVAGSFRGDKLTSRNDKTRHDRTRNMLSDVAELCERM